MDQILFSQVKIEKKNINPWFDEVSALSKKAGGPLGRFLTYFRGWPAIDVAKLHQSCEALSRDKGIPIQISVNWHLKETK